MAERFIKFIPSEKADWLIECYPNAFLLLCVIAKQARRIQLFDGLEIGDSIVGEIETPKKCGLSEKQYRNAFDKLVEFGFIKVVWNPKNKNEQKRAIKRAIKSKIVNLCNSEIWDINSEENGDQGAIKRAIKGRSEGDKSRMNKNEKENHPSYLPSDEPQEMTGLTDDFSFEKEKIEIYSEVFLTQEEINECIEIKGSLESVKNAIAFIMKSPKRKKKITDWPNALAKWEIKANVAEQARENEVYAKQLEEVNSTGVWRCQIHRDSKKDQKGLLFYLASSVGIPKEFFISFVDPDFKLKVESAIETYKMNGLNLHANNPKIVHI